MKKVLLLTTALLFGQAFAAANNWQEERSLAYEAMQNFNQAIWGKKDPADIDAQALKVTKSIIDYPYAIRDGLQLLLNHYGTQNKIIHDFIQSAHDHIFQSSRSRAIICYWGGTNVEESPFDYDESEVLDYLMQQAFKQTDSDDVYAGFDHLKRVRKNYGPEFVDLGRHLANRTLLNENWESVLRTLDGLLDVLEKDEPCLLAVADHLASKSLQVSDPKELLRILSVLRKVYSRDNPQVQAVMAHFITKNQEKPIPEYCYDDQTWNDNISLVILDCFGADHLLVQKIFTYLLREKMARLAWFTQVFDKTQPGLLEYAAEIVKDLRLEMTQGGKEEIEAFVQLFGSDHPVFIETADRLLERAIQRPHQARRVNRGAIDFSNIFQHAILFTSILGAENAWTNRLTDYLKAHLTRDSREIFNQIYEYAQHADPKFYPIQTVVDHILEILQSETDADARESLGCVLNLV